MKWMVIIKFLVCLIHEVDGNYKVSIIRPHFLSCILIECPESIKEGEKICFAMGKGEMSLVPVGTILANNISVW